MNENSKCFATYNSLLRTHINQFLKNKLKEVDNEDLVPSYGALLSIVYKNGGKVQIKTIYDTLLKQKPTITEMIKRLVKLGYLKKEGSEEDKRINYVVATEKALAFQKDFDLISQELSEKVFEGFTEEEKNQFTALILKSINNFK